ncbi:hypothetical protein MJG53_010203 [Ovis ammon polii x Ovis aries]|uniref:Uncharacterized protein n=1 Tax=Ovis ammon polii x Ovis aries TaxID=2918886 RepID=A0ACB9UT64_9CETA|nr:hypothetical protein MJG53_010203 [Ovis ammon polii x Ovis aries]
MSGKVKVWGNVVTVEWADPVEEPDPEVMAKVKVLFVRNLATTVTEEILEKPFSEFGKLERVKKLKDYAFVHFEDRGAAVKAMDEMNGKEIEGEEIEIVLAKPPDKKRKERQAARQASRSTAYEDYYYHPPPHMPPPIRGRGRGGGRGGYGYPPDYYGYEDYYDDYYGYDYHDYRGGYEDPYYGYDDGYACFKTYHIVSSFPPELERVGLWDHDRRRDRERSRSRDRDRDKAHERDHQRDRSRSPEQPWDPKTKTLLAAAPTPQTEGPAGAAFPAEQMVLQRTEGSCAKRTLWT